MNPPSIAIAARLRDDRAAIGDLSQVRSAIETHLATLAPAAAEGRSLGDAARHALLARGKRLRPLIVVLACDELGGHGLAALDAACAVEMVHAASLVLDDLPCMDNSPTRRGEPAIHAGFGEDVAVLASVSLLALAFQTLGECRTLGPVGRGHAVAALARAIGPSGLAGGQHADLRGDMSDPASVNDRKTGALFSAAVEIGILAAGADGAAGRSLLRFARELGQAFQILDDLADASGEDAGRSTLVSALGRPEALRLLARHRSAALGCLRPDGGLATLTRSILDAAFAHPEARLAAQAAG